MAESTRSETPSSLRLALTPGVFGLISGLLLVGAYELTLPTIQRHERAALREAVLEVVPQATSMEKLVVRDGRLARAVDDDETPGIYAGYDAAGKLRGYALVGAGPGFQDVIQLIYGVDVERQHITGLRVLDSRETPGLGNKITNDAEFMRNFDHLSIGPEVVAVKTKRAENEVDIITGATISSNAVIQIINQTNQHWLELLPQRPEVANDDRTSPSARSGATQP